MVDTVFLDLSIILTLAVFFAGIAALLKQPLIIGYIFTGIAISPYFLGLVHSTDAVSTFSQIGVVFLLFLVGLNLNPRVVKDVGKIAVITGVGQVVFTSVIGFFIGIALGFSVVESAYVSIALTFSSTIIIMKLLSDRGDLDSLYGRISVGFLIVQDVIAMLLLMIISAASRGFSLKTVAIQTTVNGLLLLIFLAVIGVYVLPKITKRAARSQEFLLLFAVGWCMILASICHFLDFSMEIGALFAGITLSMSPYRYEIGSRIKPLRDFFIVLFFILLGSQMVFTNIDRYVVPSIVFSLFILIGNPLIVMVLMGAMGYTKRSSFLAGLTVAQISEFSLILIALGVRVGHLTNEILSMVTIIGLVTITGSTYMIMYSDKLYHPLSKYLNVFERRGKKIDEQVYSQVMGTPELVLFGCDRIGYDVMEAFKKMGRSFIVVDYNPETINRLARENVPCRYGDASDIELLDELKVAESKMIVSTIGNVNADLTLIDYIRKKNSKNIIITVAHQIDDALKMYKVGATYVIMPYFLGGTQTYKIIEEYGLDINKFLQEQVNHISKLEKKRRLGQDYDDKK